MYTREELDSMEWDLDRHNIGNDDVDVHLLITMARQCLAYESLMGTPLRDLLDREKKSRAEQEVIDGLQVQLQAADAQRARAKAEADDAMKALKSEQDRHALTKKDHDVVLDEKKTAKAELDKWILAAKSLGRVANPQELYTWGIQFHDMERELNATDNDLFAWRQAGEQLGCLTPDDLVTLKTEYEAMQSTWLNGKAIFERLERVLDQHTNTKKRAPYSRGTGNEDAEYWMKRALVAENALGLVQPDQNKMVLDRCWRCSGFHVDECPQDPGPAHP